MAQPILYIDFGFRSAKEFWDELVLPAYERFKSKPNRQTAIEASVPAWHVLEWIWHEQHPGEDTRDNPAFRKFRDERIDECPQLAWIRDIADASKHRGLTEPKEVREMKTKIRVTGPFNTYTYNSMSFNRMRLSHTPLIIGLDGGPRHLFEDALSCVMNYWRAKYFPELMSVAALQEEVGAP